MYVDEREWMSESESENEYECVRVWVWGWRSDAWTNISVENDLLSVFLPRKWFAANFFCGILLLPKIKQVFQKLLLALSHFFFICRQKLDLLQVHHIWRQTTGTPSVRCCVTECPELRTRVISHWWPEIGVCTQPKRSCLSQKSLSGIPVQNQRVVGGWGNFSGKSESWRSTNRISW